MDYYDYRITSTIGHIVNKVSKRIERTEHMGSGCLIMVTLSYKLLPEHQNAYSSPYVHHRCCYVIIVWLFADPGFIQT